MASFDKQKEPSNMEIQIAVLSEKIDNLKLTVEEIKDQVSDSYVTKDKYEALCQRTAFLEKIVFGGVFILALAVLTAIIKLVVLP